MKNVNALTLLSKDYCKAPKKKELLDLASSSFYIIYFSQIVMK